MDFTKFMDYVREELEKILSSPGVQWQKKDGMLQCFDKACVKAIARIAKENGISLV